MSDFDGYYIKPECAVQIFWSTRGSCGNAGCTDPECCCALCGRPIGVSEDDARWDSHPEDCMNCDLCRDQVPIILFRGNGKTTQQAQFHSLCFENAIESGPRRVLPRPGAGRG
jgi:hypothetical protein